MSGSLHVFNSLTRKKEKFEPLHPPLVGLYVCGPTVYNEVHLGNLRTFTSFDIMSRYLRFLGYKVRYVRNITDVGHLVNDADAGEDKIAARARLEQLEPMEIVQKYTHGFHEVMRMFGNLPPSIEPSATGHIVEQIEMTRQILEKGLAYEVNGSVYFDVKAFSALYTYGELSGRNIEELLAGTRTLDGQDEKRNPQDFALWKKASPEHIMRWPSPWGDGFPGWHLECSVMSTKYLGTQFDIHGGGMDLKFPHHECEIAQNIAATGERIPVRYWLHGNMLTLNGKKMSKSDGNFILPGDLLSGQHPLLSRSFTPMAIRFFFLQAHYGGTLDMSEEALIAADKAYRKIAAAVALLPRLPHGKTSAFSVSDWQDACLGAMNDDFNTPVLLAHLFDAAGKVHKLMQGELTLTEADLNQFSSLFSQFFHEVLGLTLPETESQQSLSPVMDLLLQLRQQARLQKDWATSDLIRDRLLEAGIQIKDAKEGTTWNLL
jgi:cysteinyl-tRNA synthetase